MSAIIENANLTLETVPLLGTANADVSFSWFKWTNINLRNVMGPMYDKYDKFALKLVTFSTQGTITYGGGSQGNMQNLMIKGLSWVNLYNEWNNSVATSNGFAPLINYTLSSSSSTKWFTPTNNGYALNFRKTDIVDIEIRQFSNFVAGGVANPLDVYSNNCVYQFVIEPAEDNQNEMGCIQLCLADSTVVNTPGKDILNSRREFVYNNFNIFDVCREFWRKYEDFEIILANWLTISQGTSGTLANGEQIISLSGFDFMNNYSNTGSGKFVTDVAPAGYIRYGNAASTYYADYTYMPGALQFKKAQDTMRLKIQFNENDNSSLSTSTAFGSTNQRRNTLLFFVRPIKPSVGNREKGTLLLSSAGLTTTQQSFGFTNAALTDMTLNNVDLRMACRGFWDKYNKFNIFLTSASFTPTQTNLSQQVCILYCEGLNFVNQYDNSISTSQTQTWTVGPIWMGHTLSAGNIIYGTYGGTHMTTFYKTSDIARIRLYLSSVNGDAITGTTMMQGSFIFTIVGVEE